MSDSLKALQFECQDAMDRIIKHFKPGRKITVVVRSPDNPTQDFVMTNDTMEGAAEVIERRRVLGNQGPLGEKEKTR